MVRHQCSHHFIGLNIKASRDSDADGDQRQGKEGFQAVRISLLLEIGRNRNWKLGIHPALTGGLSSLYRAPFQVPTTLQLTGSLHRDILIWGCRSWKTGAWPFLNTLPGHPSSVRLHSDSRHKLGPYGRRHHNSHLPSFA